MQKRSIRIASLISTGTAMAATTLGLLLAAGPVYAQRTVIPLWANGAPGSENWAQTEVEYPMGNSGAKSVCNAVKPASL